MASSVRLCLVHSRRETRESLRSELEANGFAVQAMAFMPDISGLDQPTVLLLRWKPDLERKLNQRQSMRLGVLALIEKPSQLGMAARHSDDFVLHPFHPLELRVRVRRLLDRLETSVATPMVSATQAVIEIGDLRLDPVSARVWLADRELSLTRREYELLSVLMCRPDQIISRDHLLELAWGERFNGKARTVDQHIAQLRALLDDDVTKPRFIATRRGRGYVLMNGASAFSS